MMMRLWKTVLNWKKIASNGNREFEFKRFDETTFEKKKKSFKLIINLNFLVQLQQKETLQKS